MTGSHSPHESLTMRTWVEPWSATIRLIMATPLATLFGATYTYVAASGAAEMAVWTSSTTSPAPDITEVPPLT